MILMDDKFTVRFLMSGLSVERVKFGFLKDYAIRGNLRKVESTLVTEFVAHLTSYCYGKSWIAPPRKNWDRKF